MKKWLFVAAFFFGLWELGSYVFADSFFFPHLHSILRRLCLGWRDIGVHLGTTIKEMVFSVFWAFALAFPLGYGLFRYETLRMTLQPFFLIFQCVPMFALAPLLILCFGWTMKVIILPTVMMIVFPLTLNLYRGLLATPQDYIDFFTVHQATKWQIFWKLRLFFSLPYIFSGLRISAAIAATGVLAGEWIGGQKGLGVYMQECRFNFDIVGTYASLVCLIALTMSFYGLVSLVENQVRKNEIFSSNSSDLRGASELQ